jgi:hypothetical protein
MPQIAYNMSTDMGYLGNSQMGSSQSIPKKQQHSLGGVINRDGQAMISQHPAARVYNQEMVEGK